MNSKIIENSIKYIFEKHLKWLEDESWMTTDGDTLNRTKVVPFANICETCENIEEELISMLCGDE